MFASSSHLSLPSPLPPPPLPTLSPSPFPTLLLPYSSPLSPLHIYAYVYNPLSLSSMIHTHSLPLTYFRVSDSQLGQPEAMRLFCKDLLKNKSVVELRYTLPVASLIPSVPRWRVEPGNKAIVCT